MLDSLQQMVILATLAHEENFTRTAEKLGISKSHVSKQISALEERLGCQLVQRSTRTVNFTEIGLQVAEYGDKLIGNVEEAEAIVAGYNNEVSGVFRLAAGLSLGTPFLSSLLAEFKSAHPHLKIELSLFDHSPKILEEGYDCWLAAHDQIPESMVARKIYDCEFMLVASPDYIRQHGELLTPDELKKHNCITYKAADRSFESWAFSKDSHVAEVKVRGDLRIDNAPAIVDAAKAGLGIAYVATYLLREEVLRGELIQLLPSWTPTLQLPVYAVFPRRKHLAPKVRKFIDFAIDKMGRSKLSI
ncbi:LysR family transcriptional regulator [Thaumasiovibrio subtropicus]|uniref:LysR family transcriptional regulator n=1 Tax=Thaumasiovibrio subtropicus TaxID=1891207 RepID=UPI000B3570EB|nr:LysR family transcriptional regulator [Thaumasiovibrio subtropicus]